ncbi:MAG: ABC transporter permease [Nitrososphaerota archaeon]|nr:ABC transporter permease [Nitrososphaerota archaeon]
MAREPVVLYIISVVVFLAVWQAVSMSTTPLFLPSPGEVAAAVPSLVGSGALTDATLSTLYVFLAGLALGVAAGVPLGIVLGRFQVLNGVTYIPVTTFYSMPFVALIPLLVIWTGLGVETKAIIVFIASVFPILINTQAGIQQTNHRLLEMATSFGATEQQKLMDISIPFSVPYIMSGIRIAVGRAIVAAIVAELTTSISGLGGLLSYYGNEFATAKMMVPLVMVAFISLALTYAVKKMEERLGRWRLT